VSLAEEMNALRSSTALAAVRHVVGVRVTGDDAFDTLDALIPRKLFLRDGQAFQTVLLNRDAHVIADVCVIHDDEEFILLAEGIPEDALIAHLRAHATGSAFDVITLKERFAHFSLHGPFAWELLAELAGGRPIGVPYMTFFRTDDFFCLRSGKTGEYGYDILVEQEKAAALHELCLRRGRALDVCEIGVDALDECALENCFFNIRREGQSDGNLIELQLQWAVAFAKPAFLGRDALLAQKSAGLRRRLTHVVVDGSCRAGDVVDLRGRKAGIIVNASMRPAASTPALALLDIDLAHPGIDALSVTHEGRSAAARTVCPPLIDNLSLRVNPQRHTYAGRAELRRKA
jgi:glycine cleavage system aminomethyltransferase T